MDEEIECFISLIGMYDTDFIEEGVIVQNTLLLDEIGVLIPNSGHLRFNKTGVFHRRDRIYRELHLKPYKLVIHTKDEKYRNCNHCVLKTERGFASGTCSSSLDELIEKFQAYKILDANWCVASSKIDKGENVAIKIKPKFVIDFIESWMFKGEELLKNNWIKINIKKSYLNW